MSNSVGSPLSTEMMLSGSESSCVITRRRLVGNGVDMSGSNFRLAVPREVERPEGPATGDDGGGATTVAGSTLAISDKSHLD